MTSFPSLYDDHVSFRPVRSPRSQSPLHRIGRRSRSPSPTLMAAQRIDDLREEVTQYRLKLADKDKELTTVTSELEETKTKCERQTHLINTLQESCRIQKENYDDLVLKSVGKDGLFRHRNDIYYSSSRKYFSDQESAFSADYVNKKVLEALVKVGDSFSVKIEDEKSEDAVETLSTKALSLLKDNRYLLKKLERVEDTLSVQDLQTKASRETIMRLVSEMGKEQQSVTDVNIKIKDLETELADMTKSKEGLEKENELLQDRLSASDRMIVSSADEMRHLTDKIDELTKETEKMELDRNICRRDFELFRNSMSKILGDRVDFDLDEATLKEKVTELITNESKKDAELGALEEKLKETEEKLKYQKEIYHTTVYDLKKVERSTFETDTRVHELEDELASRDVLNDTLRRDKSEYVHFLRELADAMKVNDTLAELGHNLNTDVLIARANQLVKLESSALVEKSSSNIALRKQVKMLKEKLKSKELHLELVQKKTSDLQEKDKMRSALAIDRDDAILSVQKLQHKVERLQHALGNERVKVTNLKAELAETNELKVVSLEQKAKIEDLIGSVEKLSNKKEIQRQKLGELKHALHATEEEAESKKSMLSTQLDAVTDDLKSTKLALDEISSREKQLLEFRAVIARMLSLDVTSLSIPDYEIVSRLEALIRNHHLTAAVGAPLQALDPRFAQGYAPTGYTDHHQHHKGRRVTSPSRSRRNHSPSRRY